ncbi:MAG: hemolysin family protein [Treponema sp.]|jgi:putative hemolysin|nr:hemolysin family protein [Treponema sp.]
MEDPLPLALLAASGVFFTSLSAAALSLCRKPRLRLKAPNRGDDDPVFRALDNSEEFIFALRIWNLIAYAGATALLFYRRGPFRPPVPLVVPAAVFIVFAEVIPRLAAAANPEAIFLFCFPLVRPLCLPWKPLYLLTNLPQLHRNSGGEGEAEFRIALDEGEKSGAVEREERSMVEGVLYLGDRPVSAIMTHRSEIEWLDIDEDPASLLEKIKARRGQGFFPVVKGTQDNIAGVASTADLLIALVEYESEKAGGKAWKGLGKVMKAPRFIPETMSALKAFEAFKQGEEYYLCVMDEYGGFAGSLRLRDLVEEIVGEMTGEGELVKTEDGSWFADGSLAVDELAEKLPGFEAPPAEGREYHTLAGFILKLAGEIPRTGECFDWGGYRFRVADLDGNRIDKIMVTRP